MAILHIDNITKKFGSVVAVDNLAITLDDGELFGFIGPNGAGKTTTIKMIVGLLRPDMGTITIDGNNIVEKPREAKKLIGYIPDNPYIYDRLTGREFLELVGSLYGMERKVIQERIDFLFDLFSIEDWGDDFAAEYSHGMRQKVIGDYARPQTRRNRRTYGRTRPAKPKTGKKHTQKTNRARYHRFYVHSHSFCRRGTVHKNRYNPQGETFKNWNIGQTSFRCQNGE